MATKISNLKTKDNSVKLSLLDKFVSFISPSAGLKRIAYRSALMCLGNTGFISSGSGKRSVLDWFPRPKSADQDSVPQLPDIRASSRDLAMNMPIAKGALERVKVNAVGTGLNLQSTIDRDFLKLSDEKASEWERNTEREFNVWAKSKECDASGKQNFYGLQQLAMYNTILSGDIFAAMLSIDRNNFPYKFKIKMIESDQCSNPNGKPDGPIANSNNKLVAGIEQDEYDFAVKYYFKKSLYKSYDNTWTSVDAFGKSGLPNVLHLYDRERPGQSRGIPMLAPVIEPLKQLVRYSEAELMATIIASFFTVFVKTKTPLSGGIGPMFGAPNTIIPGSPIVNADNDEKRKLELAPGTVVELDKDEEIDVADPRRPNEQFEPFFLAYVKQIGSALNIPFEELILHFSSSYSASRAAILQAWKFYKMRRFWLVGNLCDPVYFRWLTESITLGRIDAPGFFEDVSIAMAWAGSIWGGPGIGQIDPKKETEAAVNRIDNYLSNREIESTAINGGSARWEGIMKRNASEKKMIEEATGGLLEENNSTSTEDKPTLDEMEDER